MRTLTAIFVLLCVTPVVAQSPEETARRYVTLAYEGAFHALPKTPDAKTEKFELSVRKMLRVQCPRVEKLAFHDVTSDTVPVVVTVRGEMQDVIPLRLKIADGLVTAVEFPDEELADQLLAATDDEQLRILRAHPGRVTKNLARTIYLRALAIFNFSTSSTPAEVSRNARRAGALARKVAMLAGDIGGEAMALGIDSIDAWMHQQDADRGVALARESLAIAETSGESGVLARSWYNLGRAIGMMADRDAAYAAEGRACYHHALPHAERAEDPYVLVRTLVMLAGEADSACDHLTQRRYADRVLAIARETNDIGGQIDGEGMLYDAYEAQSDSERSWFHLQRAVALAEKHRSRIYPALQIRVAMRAVEEGRYDEARALFAKALPVNERGEVVWNSVAPRGNVLTALEWLAEIEARTGNMAEAECLVAQSGGVRSWLGRYYARAGNHPAALQAALEALDTSSLSPGTRITALTTAARAYRDLGDPEKAMLTILEAIEEREEIARFVFGGEQQQVRESNARTAQYGLAAELALDDGDAPGALAFLEAARARVLTDIVEHGRPGAMAEADAAGRKERSRRERALAKLNLDLDRARANGDGAAAATLANDLAAARAEYDSFVDGLHSHDERRGAARRRTDVTRLPAGTAAVEYFIADDALHAFVVRDGRIVHRSVKIERKSLETRVEAFVSRLTQRDLRVREAARDIHSLLVEPVARELAGAKTLLVVPDGVLWRVPFAALSDARHRWLIEDHSVVYAPSITAFLTIFAGNTKTHPPSFFAVGNPSLGTTAEEVESFYRDTSLGPLPDAEREVDVARTFYDARRAVVLKGKQATEVATLAALSNATVIHFATHALLDDTHPLYSRLALTPDGGDDGWLEGWEIARLDLDADVVILSACETARGAIGGGEGVVGMAWSFFLAGARSTVATQWRIASSSTADLMIAFHRSLRANGNKANALRDAQLALLRNREYEHPFYWGAFVLIGDPGVNPPSATTYPAVPGPAAARVARRTPPRM